LKVGMMVEEIYPHRVWAEGTDVEPGLLRFAHYEIAGVKYVDLLVYGVADSVRAWRATIRLKSSEIADLVTEPLRTWGVRLPACLAGSSLP
jgi:hypothetical protein